MNGTRTFVLMFLLVALLFCGTVAGVMIATHLAERNNIPPESETIESLRTLLQKHPDYVEVRDALRREDRRLIAGYLARRKRIKTGARLLFAGVLLVIVLGKWYALLDPRIPAPSSPTDRADEDRWLKKRRRNLIAVTVVAILVVAVVPVMISLGRCGRTGHDFKENWPRFRGPTGMGIVRGGDWPKKWDAASGGNIVWKVPVPVPGKNSPVIWGDRIFLTGADATKQEVLCFERVSGKLLWRTAVRVPGRPRAGAGEEDDELEVTDGAGYAAPTAATDGERVYAFFATADLAALDFEGKIVWVRNLGKPGNTYGIAVSPIVYKQLLIVQFDRGSDPDEGASTLLGLDGKTGREIWREDRPVPNSWSTPVCVKTKSGVQLLTVANPWVIGYGPGYGTELWRADVLTGDVAACPVYAGGVVYVTNENSLVAAVRTDGEGDVTKTHVVWTADEGMSDASSPVCDGTYFIQANSSGVVTCYEAKTGKLLWEKEIDCEFWASATLVGDLVYLPGDDGNTYIFKLAGEFELVSKAGLGETLYATPAFADSRIYFRGEKHLFCVGDRLEAIAGGTNR